MILCLDDVDTISTNANVTESSSTTICLTAEVIPSSIDPTVIRDSDRFSTAVAVISTAIVSSITVTYLTTSVTPISSATVLSSSVMYSILCISTTANTAVLLITDTCLITSVIMNSQNSTSLMLCLDDVDTMSTNANSASSSTMNICLTAEVIPSSIEPTVTRDNDRFSIAVAVISRAVVSTDVTT